MSDRAFEPVYGVEFDPAVSIYYVVDAETLERVCLTTFLAQGQAENVADALNTAHYKALGQEWTRANPYPIFNKRPNLAKAETK